MFFIPPEIIEDIISVADYAENKLIFHVGTENTVNEGIRNFYENLDRHGQILINEPEMVDYLNCNGKLSYIILYESLGKLEYLEYLWAKSVDNNAK
jgi:hypothetical protein